jgi:hypothetical protein
MLCKKNPCFLHFKQKARIFTLIYATVPAFKGASFNVLTK